LSVLRLCEQNLSNGADISLRFYFYPRDALLMKAHQESRIGNNIAFDGALAFRFAGWKSACCNIEMRVSDIASLFR